MTKVAAMNFFAALPGRVTLDDRLTGLHFRILATVAGHDRMGRNGQCCWLKRDKLAVRVSCHPISLSKAVTELTAWGYLETVQSQDDKRRKGFRIVYSMDEDRAGIGATTRENTLPKGTLSHENGLPIGHQSSENGLPVGNVKYADRLPECNKSSQCSAENIEQKQRFITIDGVSNIFSKTEDNRRSQNTALPKVYGAATHRPLAKMLGNEGWEILASMSDDDRKFLERKYSDGVLTEGDLFEARNAFRQQRSA